MKNIVSILSDIDKINNHNFLILSDQLEICSIKKNPPINIKKIKEIEKKHSLKFSDSLINFWKNCNGIIFNHYGGTRIYSINEVDEICSIYRDIVQEGIYFIGTFDGDILVMDSNQIENENYILYGDECDLDSLWNLHTNFENILLRLIQTGGNKYWDWTPWDIENRKKSSSINIKL